MHFVNECSCIYVLVEDIRKKRLKLIINTHILTGIFSCIQATIHWRRSLVTPKIPDKNVSVDDQFLALFFLIALQDLMFITSILSHVEYTVVWSHSDRLPANSVNLITQRRIYSPKANRYARRFLFERTRFELNDIRLLTTYRVMECTGSWSYQIALSLLVINEGEAGNITWSATGSDVLARLLKCWIPSSRIRLL